MSANALPATIAAIGAAGVSYWFIFSMTSERHVLARAQSEGYAPPKPKLVRRHSTGDHVFLPDQNHKAAINAAKKNFGVPPETMQDREVFAILALLTMPV